MNDQGNNRVCILLAVFNGARFLPEQLQSYADQTLTDWCLLASDDGSTDDSRDILAGFAADHEPGQVQIIAGPKQGHFAQNFLHLIRNAPEDCSYFALSDQDDVWLADKLAMATERLADMPPDLPALYCARTIICDDNLASCGQSPAFRRPPGFGNALVQSIGGGNTMVLNRAALSLAKAAASETGDIVAHDWWLYQIISGVGGVIVNDPRPVLKYRQHEHNQIGANLSYRAKMSRIWALLNGRFRRWNDCNVAALSQSVHRFTDESRAQLALFAQARAAKNPLRRLILLRRSGVVRQGKLGTLALFLSCVIYRM